MNDRWISRWRRASGSVVMAVALVMGVVHAPAAHAQEAPAGEESKGDPVPGYLGTLLLCMGIMFVVGKSARR